MRRIALAIGGLALLTGIPAHPASGEPPPRIVAAYHGEGVPAGADDPAWEGAPEVTLPLMAQMIAPPVGGGGTEGVALRAIHDGTWLGIRLSWKDETPDRGVGVDRFRDAVAVGFPQHPEQGPTSPFMGDAEHPVTIWQWSADLDAAAGGDDRTAERYRGSQGTWYFADDETVTARVRRWRGREPVGVFIATGFGALERAAKAEVEGASRRSDDGWSVVLRRRLEAGGAPAFAPGAQTRVIVAVWDGGRDEVNGRKSVTMSWTPFELAPLEESHAAR